MFESYAERLEGSVARSPGYCVTMDGVTLTACSKSYLVGTIHYLDSAYQLRAATLGAYRLLESHTCAIASCLEDNGLPSIIS